MVTRILFDPRRDLPDGTTISYPVTVTATPLIVREDGAVVIVPSTLTFTVNTAADQVQLPPSTASDGWRLTVTAATTGTVLQTRTVRIPDTYSVDWQSIPDVDPASLTVNTGTARQWDATFRALAQLIQGGGSGSGGGLEYVQATPSASWTIPHAFGRRPSVTVYDSNGDWVVPDVHATLINVALVFASPLAGTAVLT